MSSYLNTYSIHFKGLKVGKHSFNLEIDKRFFDEFEELFPYSPGIRPPFATYSPRILGEYPENTLSIRVVSRNSPR